MKKILFIFLSAALANLASAQVASQFLLPPNGTSGKILKKNSATDGDFTWADYAGSAALTTFSGGAFGTAAASASSAFATATQGATADAAAVASTTTAALALKAPLASPAFTGTVTAATITASGAVTGSNLSGTNTGDQTTVTGNAGTATTLATSRNINGAAFNGSADITVAAAAGTLTGATLAAGVTASSLTSFGASAIIRNQSLLNNFSTASQSPAAATRTYLTGSSIAAPAGKLQIGTRFRWTFDITKTAAGVAASTFDICVGTAGTTADTARVSFTKPAGTAVVDTGKIVIECIIRGPLSASGIAVGTFNLTHNLSATGHATIPCVNVVTVSSAFDVTTANLIVGVCATTGASDAITIQSVLAESWNL